MLAKANIFPEVCDVWSQDMEEDCLDLSRLPIGTSAIVKALQVEGFSRRRLLDLGLVPCSLVKAVRQSPVGEPRAYEIRGALIALRQEEAAQILVLPVNSSIS